MKTVTIDIPDNKTQRLFKEFASENGIKILPFKSEIRIGKKKTVDKIPDAVTRKAIADINAGKAKRTKNVTELISKILS